MEIKIQVMTNGQTADKVVIHDGHEDGLWDQVGRKGVRGAEPI
jgi:hypothetical protein